MEPDPDKALSEWFDGALGSFVLREEAAIVRRALDDVFGFEFLQLGTFGAGRTLLDGTRTAHAILAAAGPSGEASLSASLDMLPFASDSIDAVLLPHTLELVDDPHAVLREANRVLCAEGCLLICGFNPWSGWGARRLFAGASRGQAFPPRVRRLLTEHRLRDWVALLGFDVDRVSGYLGAMPLAGGAGGGERSTWMSGAYLLKARKRVQTLTPVRRRGRAPKRVFVPVPEPTSSMQPRP